MATSAHPTSIEIARLYERTSQRGTRYFVGRLGLARITLLPGDVAEDGTATWRMLLQEASNSRASADRPASHSPRRASRARRQPVGDRPAGRPMPDDSVADFWANALDGGR